MPSFSKVVLAFLLATAAVALPAPQLHGEGVAADALLTDTDNGVGYGIENAEDNLAGNVATVKGTTPAAPAARRTRRQLDKVAHGAQTISNAAGTGGSTENASGALVNADGDLTNNAADIGTEVGGTEADTLEGTGKAVPKH